MKLEQGFLGAHRVLSDDGNPDRLALAAHGFREVMKDLGKHVPGVPTHQALGDKVHNLVQVWPAVVPDRDQPIPSRVRKFLLKMAEFVAWHGEHQSSQDRLARAILGGLSNVNAPLPENLERERSMQWQACRDYFTKVAHHDRDPDRATFEQHLEFLEATLHTYLVPRPVVRLAEIDRLIQLGESGGS